jgi:hypothetical protein
MPNSALLDNSANRSGDSNALPDIDSPRTTDSIQARISEVEQKYENRLKQLGISPIHDFIPEGDPRAEGFRNAWLEYREEYQNIISLLPAPPEVPPGWEGYPPEKAIESVDDLVRFLDQELGLLHALGRSRSLGQMYVELSAQAVLNAHRWLLHAGIYQFPFPPRPTNFDDAERELANLLAKLNEYRRSVKDKLPRELLQKSVEQRAPSIMVDLERRTATIVATRKEFELKSEQSLRWLKVLSENEGKWIAGPKLKDYDQALDGGRTDRLRKGLPSQLSRLITTSKRLGARLKMA